jgi:hypothetical protein
LPGLARPGITSGGSYHVISHELDHLRVFCSFFACYLHGRGLILAVKVECAPRNGPLALGGALTNAVEEKGLTLQQGRATTEFLCHFAEGVMNIEKVHSQFRGTASVSTALRLCRLEIGCFQPAALSSFPG